MNPWWSVGLTVGGVFGIYLTTKKLWWGFLVGVLMQAVWVAYAIATRQWGFLGSAAAYGGINALGLYRWTNSARVAKRNSLDSTNEKEAI